ncbi:hypothetical protein KKG51_00045, partial [Patescibacteria group bacterium]|nr:hypothetical protein [Patescibacteria group bacterium]
MSNSTKWWKFSKTTVIVSAFILLVITIPVGDFLKAEAASLSISTCTDGTCVAYNPAEKITTPTAKIDSLQMSISWNEFGGTLKQDKYKYVVIIKKDSDYTADELENLSTVEVISPLVNIIEPNPSSSEYNYVYKNLADGRYFFKVGIVYYSGNGPLGFGNKSDNEFAHLSDTVTLKLGDVDEPEIVEVPVENKVKTPTLYNMHKNILAVKWEKYTGEEDYKDTYYYWVVIKKDSDFTKEDLE